MKIKILNLKILVSTLLGVLPLFAWGVNQQEMEQARTIAAKSYLRYANDGSGYLDDLNPKTMEELEASLKAKEKENIKAFKAIPVPTDYKDWNKEKLVEYWAVTAFQTKGLLEKGLGGRIRARSQINKMTIAPPQPESPAAVPETSGSQEKIEDSMSQNPTAQLDSLKNAEEALLSMEMDEEESINVQKENNYTWVYIMILGILVAVVVALVVFAANVFKKNEHDTSNHDESSESENYEHYESMISDKDVEIAMMKKKLEAANKKNLELQNKMETMAAELEALKSSSQHQLQNKTIPQIGAEEDAKVIKQPLRSIYLGRANSRGIFVRADRTLNVGNSVFVLETSDGFSGSFKVANSPAAWSLALSNPHDYLETACTGHNLEDTADASRIITESSGTAVFEGGCWRVIRKAKIRYEA